MTRPGALESKKTRHGHFTRLFHEGLSRRKVLICRMNQISLRTRQRPSHGSAACNFSATIEGAVFTETTDPLTLEFEEIPLPRHSAETLAVLSCQVRESLHPTFQNCNFVERLPKESPIRMRKASLEAAQKLYVAESMGRSLWSDSWLRRTHYLAAQENAQS
jgi:hypothetical protein